MNSITRTPQRRLADIERVAHRGSPRECVENTLDGFLLALEHGANSVELDVHCSADREVVVFHDHHVQGRRVSEMSWKELSRIDLGGGVKMPLLADVLSAIDNRAMVYVELKGAAIEREVLETASRHGALFALHSFDHDAIARVARIAPEVRRGVLLDRELPDAHQALRESIARTEASDVWPHWSLVDQALTALAHQLGARVITWTVNTGDVAESVLRAGVDGICTDDVRLFATWSAMP